MPLPPPPTQADLTVTSFHVIDSEGPDIACKLTVENEGSESTSSEFKNIVYLSQDKTITNTNYRVADWNVTESLAPGESKTSWNLSFAVSDVPAGEYYLGAMADAYNNINESDENNNTKCANSPMVNIPEGYEDPVEPEDPEEP